MLVLDLEFPPCNARRVGVLGRFSDGVFGRCGSLDGVLGLRGISGGPAELSSSSRTVN